VRTATTKMINITLLRIYLAPAKNLKEG